MSSSQYWTTGYHEVGLHPPVSSRDCRKLYYQFDTLRSPQWQNHSKCELAFCQWLNQSHFEIEQGKLRASDIIVECFFELRTVSM